MWKSDGPTRSRRRPVSLAELADYARTVLENARALPGETRVSARLPELDATIYLDEGEFAEAIRDNLVTETPISSPAEASPCLEVRIVHGEQLGILQPACWRDSSTPAQKAYDLLAEAGLRGTFYPRLDFWQFYDVASRYGVQLMRGPSDYPPWESAAPLRPFLHWAYAEKGLRLSHCGTVGLDTGGLLIAGRGGAGKSATVIAGLLHGLSSVGDDYVLLKATDQIVAFPIFATLKQDPKGYERLSLEDHLQDKGRPNWQGKYQFRMDDIAAPPPPRMRIDALMIAAITGDKNTRIVSMPPRDAIAALASSSIDQMPGERQTGFEFFGRVVRSLPTYRLELGKEPSDTVEKICDFLQRGRP